MTGVPVALRVSGRFDNLSYGPATPRTAERAGDAVDSGSRRIDKTLKEVTHRFKKKR